MADQKRQQEFIQSILSAVSEMMNLDSIPEDCVPALQELDSLAWETLEDIKAEISNQG